MHLEAYDTFKSFGNYLRVFTHRVELIGDPYSYFIKGTPVQNLYTLTQKVILKENLLAMNGYLSGLISLICLKVEEELKEDEKRRMLVLAIMKID